MKDSNNVGTLQYSRGWNIDEMSPAAPTPVTHLQSQSTAITVGAGSTIDVLNFAGLTRAMAMIYAFDQTSPTIGKGVAYVIYNGSNLFITPVVSTVFLVFQVFGTDLLQIKNNSSNPMNIFWTLDLVRMQ